MNVESTSIADVKLILPRVFEDERGFFTETWNRRVFSDEIAERSFVQDNQSGSIRHTLRGLHYQVVRPQGKLVRVVSGEVFDVAVDLRRSSATFGQWTAAVLSASNKHQLWIPEGFAHGFFTVSDYAELVYKCTDYYFPEHERTLLWNDPDLAIDWPLPGDVLPVLSAKDKAGATLAASEVFA